MSQSDVPGTDDPGLTAADFETLADIAENGPYAYAKNGGGRTPEPDGEPVTCHRCGYGWRYTGDALRATCPVCGIKTRRETVERRDDGRGLTVPMCNAIREAARDGLTYREIADLFGFVNDPTAAHRHATGQCSHDGPAVESARDPGPMNPVDDAECAALRERYADGESVNDLSDATGRAQSTVYRHVSGGCSHGGGE